MNPYATLETPLSVAALMLAECGVRSWNNHLCQDHQIAHRRGMQASHQSRPTDGPTCMVIIVRFMLQDSATI